MTVLEKVSVGRLFVSVRFVGPLTCTYFGPYNARGEF